MLCVWPESRYRSEDTDVDQSEEIKTEDGNFYYHGYLWGLYRCKKKIE